MHASAATLVTTHENDCAIKYGKIARQPERTRSEAITKIKVSHAVKINPGWAQVQSQRRNVLRERKVVQQRKRTPERQVRKKGTWKK